MQEGLNQEMLVRGISLISFREYLRAQLTPEEFSEFFSRMPPEETEIILDPDKARWYPFTLQYSLRKHIAEWFDDKEPQQAIFDACLFTADYEMSTFLKGMMSFLPVKLVIRQTANLWHKYYTAGDLRVTSYKSGHIVLELTDFPADELFAPTMTAWLTVASQMLNLKDARVSQTADIHNGDALWRWEINWK